MTASYILWTAREDKTLVDLRDVGMSWHEIVERLPGRTDKACKTRYALLTKPKAAEGEPKPHDNPYANAIGCQMLHDAHMRVHGGWRVAA